MPTTLATGLTAAVGAGANLDIQPAAGQAYCIIDIFSDTVFVGNRPDLQFALRNGVQADAIIVIDPTTEVQKGTREFEIYIDNTTYLRIVNRAAGNAVIGHTGYRVIPSIIRTRVVTAPNGGAVAIQPPLGEVWRVTEIGAETMNATNEPDLIVRLIDAVSVAAILVQGTTDLGWDKPCDWYIDNDLWLSIAPIAAADNDVGISAILVPVQVFGDAVTAGAGATVAIQPPEGQEAVVTAFGSETWAGIAPAGSPDVTWSLTDGVTPSDVAEPGSVADSAIHNRAFHVYIDNTIYMQAVDTGGAGQDVAWTGYVRRQEATT